MGSFVRRGDGVLLTIFSTFPAVVAAEVTIRKVDGSYETVRVAETTTGTVTGEESFRTSSQFSRDGEVTNAVILNRISGKRGQTYGRLQTTYGQGPIRDVLCAGYLYGARVLTLGVNEGSREGPGFRHSRAIAEDQTPVGIEMDMEIGNQIRRVDGFVWYYHCSGDVATRTLQVSVRDLGNGLPTGMTSGSKTTVKLYPSAGVMSLTANQEGVIYVNANTGKSFAVSVDDSAKTIEDITTEPDPFPYWADESERGEIFFNVQDEEVADRHSIYLFEEVWMDV